MWWRLGGKVFSLITGDLTNQLEPHTCARQPEHNLKRNKGASCEDRIEIESLWDYLPDDQEDEIFKVLSLIQMVHWIFRTFVIKRHADHILQQAFEKNDIDNYNKREIK